MQTSSVAVGQEVEEGGMRIFNYYYHYYPPTQKELQREGHSDRAASHRGCGCPRHPEDDGGSR